MPVLGRDPVANMADVALGSNPFIDEHLEVRALVNAAHRADLGALEHQINKLSEKYERTKAHTVMFATDDNGDTALHKAAHLGHVDILEYLLGNEIFLNEPGTRVSFIEQKNNQWSRAVHIAVEKGQIDYLMGLQQNGASLDTPGRLGSTPLHLAIRSYIKVYPQANPHFALPQNSNSPAPPVNPAIHNPWTQIVAWLISKRVNINAIDNMGETALHIAARNKINGLIHMLLREGADPNIQNYLWHTALHLAIQGPSSLECVRTLLRGHANPNSYERIAPGDTPLHVAIRESNVNIIELLLEHGSHEYYRNANGLTPRQLAMLKSDECSAFFINRDTDPARQRQQ